jgi:hypothetical protein
MGGSGLGSCRLQLLDRNVCQGFEQLAEGRIWLLASIELFFRVESLLCASHVGEAEISGYKSAETPVVKAPLGRSRLESPALTRSGAGVSLALRALLLNLGCLVCFCCCG